VISISEINKIVAKTSYSFTDFSTEVFGSQKMASVLKNQALERGSFTLQASRKIINRFKKESVSVLKKERVDLILMELPTYGELGHKVKGVKLSRDNFTKSETRSLRSLRSTISSNKSKEISLNKLLDFLYFYDELIPKKSISKKVRRLISIYKDFKGDVSSPSINKDGRVRYKAIKKGKNRKKQVKKHVSTFEKSRLLEQKRTRVLKTKASKEIYDKLITLSEKREEPMGEIMYKIIVHELSHIDS